MKKYLIAILIMILVGCSAKVDYLNIDDDTLRDTIVNNFKKEFNDKFTVDEFSCRVVEEKKYGNVKSCSYVLLSDKYPDYPISGTKLSTNLKVDELEKREYSQIQYTIKMNNIYQDKIEEILNTDILLFVDEKDNLANDGKCNSFWNTDCKIFTFFIAIQVNDYEEADKYIEKLKELNEQVKYQSNNFKTNDIWVYFVNDFSQIEYIKHLASGPGINKGKVYFGHTDLSNDGFDVLREIKSADLID